MFGIYIHRPMGRGPYCMIGYYRTVGTAHNPEIIPGVARILARLER